uniref:LRR-RLK n=1 Tax=Vernicia montana TaxID=316732 RepID=A0A140G4T4_9ROSI|nr:LRR-RLK [Vernicia montana]
MSGCSKLEELPQDLGNLKSLVVFNLDGTAINTLPETIQNLKTLETLSLRECHLIFSPRNSPHVISLLPYSLKELDIGYCNILDGVIPRDLQGLSFLKELKLCGNHFTSLPASIGSLPKLDTLWLNDCRRLQSIPQLHSSLESLHANQCPTLESINLKNFRGDSELEVNGCPSLKEIDGFFNLEPLEVEIAEKLLRSNSLFTQELITNIHVRKIDNLTKTNKISPLQLNPGFKIIGIATCAIYAWRGSDKSCYFTPCITISDKTKMFDWIYTPYISFFSSDVKQNMSWLGYWMFNNLEKGIDEIDTGWRFKDELEEGDEVEFSIDMGLGVHVKKCGIHLLYQPIDQGSQSDDLAIISNASSKHHRRFMHSRPWLLTIGDDQEIAPELQAAHPQNEEFSHWSKQRKEKLNQMDS